MSMMEIGEQVERMGANPGAAQDVAAAIVDQLWSVADVGGARRMSSVGLEDYGDEIWHRPVDEIALEAMQEVMDLRVYLGVLISRGVDVWSLFGLDRPGA